MMETDFITSITSAEQQTMSVSTSAPSLGGAVVPVTSATTTSSSSYLAIGKMQYDTTVPMNLFSDGENSDEDDFLDVGGAPDLLPSPDLSNHLHIDQDGTISLLLDPNTDTTSGTTSHAAHSPADVIAPTVHDSSIDSLNVDSLFDLGDDFKMPDLDISVNDHTELFENGIAASDMSSLLEQFEEAAANLPEVDPLLEDEDDDVDVGDEQATPSSPEVSSKSEVMRLLMSKHPVAVPQSKKGLGAASKNISASKRPPPSPTPKTPPPKPTKPGPMKAISGKPRNMFFPAKPVPPTKTSIKPPKTRNSSSKRTKADKSRKEKESVKQSNDVKTPSAEMLQKIRSANKRKSTIMLPSAAVPVKTERSGRSTRSSSSSSDRSMTQKVASSVTKELHVETRSRRRNPVSCNSAPCSPKSSTHNIGTSSAPVSPIQRTSAVTDRSLLLPQKPGLTRNSFSETDMKRLDKPSTVEAAPAAVGPERGNNSSSVSDGSTLELSSDYFSVTVDHDYCQNSYPSSPAPSSPSTGTSGDGRIAGTSATVEEEDGSVLKSLLLNKHLAAQLQRQAAADRSRQRRKVSVNLDVIDMEIDEQQDAPPPPAPRLQRVIKEKKRIITPPDSAHVIGGIAVGVPLPPLPPLDQLPKDCELRQLGNSGSDSNDSVRPSNDMNVILNKVKECMYGGPKAASSAPAPVMPAALIKPPPDMIKEDVVNKAVKDMKHILHKVPQSQKAPSSRHHSRSDPRVHHSRHSRRPHHSKTSPASEMNAILNKATLLPSPRITEPPKADVKKHYHRDRPAAQDHRRDRPAKDRSEMNAILNSIEAIRRSVIEAGPSLTEAAHAHTEAATTRSEAEQPVLPMEEDANDGVTADSEMVHSRSTTPSMERSRSTTPVMVQSEASSSSQGPIVMVTTPNGSNCGSESDRSMSDSSAIAGSTSSVTDNNSNVATANNTSALDNSGINTSVLDNSSINNSDLERSINLPTPAAAENSTPVSNSAADVEQSNTDEDDRLYDNAVLEIPADMTIDEHKPDETLPPIREEAEQGAAPPNKTKRNYRKREKTLAKDEGHLFDKLPGYFTTLTKVQKPEKGQAETHRALTSEVRGYDRDPSPERDIGFSKLPSYLCFTNSTKYDNDQDQIVVPPAGNKPYLQTIAQISMEERLSGGTPYGAPLSVSSTRSNTPNLVIASRANSESRTTSRAPSRSSSSSSSCSTCDSGCSSREASRSPSPQRHRQQSRGRSVRRTNYRRKRHSYSSSHSSSESGSRSRSRSRSRSQLRFRSPRRSSSRSSSRSRSSSVHRDMRRREDRIRPTFEYRSPSQSREYEYEREQERKEKLKRKRIEERRIVYVGRIAGDFTRRDLRKQFERFGEIEDVSVHFREHGGDHYGFVTFLYTCDAYSAIERGNKMKDMEKYDLCFGGRREFCKASYADLDGNMEIEEEMAPVTAKRPMAAASASMDFDELLRQARTKIKKPKPATSTDAH